MAQADLRGDITKTGGEDLDERGFVYGTSSHGDPGNTAPSNSSYASNVTQTSGPYSTGTFTITETGLGLNTTYYYRAVGHNSAGWSYGDEVSLTTPVAIRVNDGGTWTEPTEIWVNDGGTWTKVQGAWVNDGGSWKKVA